MKSFSYFLSISSKKNKTFACKIRDKCHAERTTHHRCDNEQHQQQTHQICQDREALCQNHSIDPFLLQSYNLFQEINND